MNPFDFVNAISFTKKDIMEDDLSEREYASFITNRTLSYHQDCIMYANEINRRHHLDSRLQFHYFLNTLRKRKRFAKWVKPSVLEDMKIIQDYYECSKSKAEEYLRLLTAKEIEELKNRMNKGGRQ